MNAESFFVQYAVDGPLYHGDAGCDYSEAQTFDCTRCGRVICYCGGHDGAGTVECRQNCAKCDECCDA